MFYKVRCPICYANIETSEVPEKCPACKEYIKDRIPKEEIADATAPKRTTGGITTARTRGPGLSPWGV